MIQLTFLECKLRHIWDSFDEKVDAIALDNEDWYLVDTPFPLDDNDDRGSSGSSPTNFFSF